MVAVVGSGSAARRHVQVLREALPAARVVTVQRQGSTPIAEADRVVHGVGELGTDRPDVAIVANAANGHVASAMALLEAGAHVLVEKPMAVEVGDARSLVDAFGAANRVLAVCYQLRQSAPLQRVWTLLQSGSRGRIVHVAADVGQWLPDWRPTVDYRTTPSARHALGGGALLELSHELDYVRWLLDGAEVEGAVVQTSGCLDVDVEDVADVLLRGRHATATVHVDFLQRPAHRSCRVLTDEGALVADLILGDVTWCPRSTAEEVVELAADPSWATEAVRATVVDFLRSAATGATPAVTGKDGLATLELVEAARRRGQGCR